MLILSAIIGSVNAVSGYWLASIFDVSIAGAIATTMLLIFGLVFLTVPNRGLIAIARRHARQKWEFAQTMLVIHLFNHEGLPEAEAESAVAHLHKHLSWNPDFTTQVVKYALNNRCVSAARDAADLNGTRTCYCTAGTCPIIMLHEDTITAKLVDLLEPMRIAWRVEPQNTQTFLSESQRPDFTVKERGRDPVIIEVKIDEPNAPNLSGEAQAREHLGRQLVSYERVKTTMALRLPHRFRHTPHRELEAALRKADDLHYVLLSGDTPEDIHRFPNEGWIQGNLTDIAMAIRIGAIPISKVANAAYDLEHGVNETALLLEAAIHQRPGIAQLLEAILHQEAGEQTSRMAMLIITNAFVFQSSLAGTSEMENVPSLRRLRGVGERLNSDEVLEAWDSIRQVNYRPIFDVAYELVVALATDDRLVGRVLWLLRNTAQKLIDRGLEQVHELAGIVFQRLIVDRKFIKTYYTRPESVALLAALVLPNKLLMNGDFETIRSVLSNLKIADFACGTGALLNGVYQQLLAIYEQAGGNGKDIHQRMVENNLVGCDIMPNASHLTASLIASNFPDIKIGGTQIDVMEYGVRRTDGRYALGALDLIENPEATLSLGLINTKRVRGDASEDNTPQPEFRHGEIDIVVDNPPFTRAGADNNATDPDVPKTIFGDRDAGIAAEMKRTLRKIENSIGNSNAGFGSYFVDLADRMLKDNGQRCDGIWCCLSQY